MPVEVSVGPQVLTINHGATFAVTDRAGEIVDGTEQGVFCNDTRFVSSYRIYANGQPWLLLTSGTPTHYLARVHLVNRPFSSEDGDVPEATLDLLITRAVSEGIHEDLDVTNYGLRPVRFNLEIAIRADFADLFEVRALEERFWCEDIGFYAFCLDPDKEPVRTIASNPGHLLWSGIASPDRASRVVQRLLEPDMWTGWGIRTLSARNPAYNPFAYQRGSVWPHDNGIIALGFKRYGFAGEAARVARDISEAASHFASQRLPELYAGIEQRPGGFPVQYLGANVPQAWAAGSVFHLLQAILGIQADAPRERLYVDPQLPRWLPDVTLQGVAVGRAKVDLRFRRVGEQTEWDATVREGDVEVQAQPWRSWTMALRGG